MRRTKQTLAFEMLEKEMTLLTATEKYGTKGGSTGIYPPGEDCFFYSFSGTLAQLGITSSSSTLEAQYNFQYGANASSGGVSVTRELDFMRAVFAGCNYSVQISDIANLSQTTATALFAAGDHFIGNIDNGDGTYHAVTITGINANGTYKYNDYQNNRIGWDASASSFHSAIRVSGGSSTGVEVTTGNSSGGN